MLIVYPADDAPMGWLDKEDTQTRIANKISEYIGKQTDVEFQKVGSRSEIRSVYPDILKMAGINTTIVEED